MNRDQLLEVMDQYKIPVLQRDVSTGGTIVAARRGARILGLFPSRRGTCSSALWINPNIEALLSGKAADWSGDGEGGLGGDRLWVSPERNFYYEKPSSFEGWFCPLEMDPGAYGETQSDAASTTWENRLDLKDRYRGLTLSDVTMRRNIRVLENPFSESGPGPETWGRAGYVGVETIDEIEIPSSQSVASALCPWGLTQVVPPPAPGAGTVVVPTRSGARPVHYFGPVPSDRLRVGSDHVTFRIDALSITKIGIRPEDLRPDVPRRIGYLAPAQPDPTSGGKAKSRSGNWVVVVRESTDVVRSATDALDPAKADPDGPRGVVQSYCSGPNGRSEWARFGEIEMQHVPLRQDASGAWKSRATSRLLAFEGAQSDILAIACHVLGIYSIDLFE
ncbi:hypothetical protein JW916_02785 [Candidatus Sumerlaeota bacterium]|nr:hypothetical protein [Candidatus Sumerlaeota bacterium]